jgi:hypothetical protein
LKSQGKLHLQSIGDVKGTLAKDLKVGDILMWNYGYQYEVVSVKNVSANFIEIKEAGHKYK